MSFTLLDHSRNRSAADALADELIAASHAHPTDKIIVAGTDQLELLISFLRRGFLDAACAAARGGPAPGLRFADILIASSLSDKNDLDRVLRSLGGALRPGGIVLIRETPSAAPFLQQQFLPIFLKFGFATIERLTSRNNAGGLWRARKEIKIAAKAA